MESTKAALENERKIQQLQMQAINALWKKVSQMGPTPTTTTNPTTTNASTEIVTAVVQPDSGSTEVVQDLTKTCTALTNQVQQLQSSMRDVLNCMTLFCNISTQQSLAGGSSKNDEKIESCSTQTEIIAVNTPQVENLPFPFTSKVPRPSTLPLDSNSPKSEGLLNTEKNDANESESNKIDEEQLKAN